MTAIRPERLGADRASPEKKLSEADQATAAAFEGEIREFVRRDVALLRRPRSEAEPVSESVPDNLNVLIQRVSGASIEEIDRVILDLQGVRDMLRIEGERVSREITGYTSLSYAAMTAMKVIADNLAKWKSTPNSGERPAG